MEKVKSILAELLNVEKGLREPSMTEAALSDRLQVIWKNEQIPPTRKRKMAQAEERAFARYHRPIPSERPLTIQEEDTLYRLRDELPPLFGDARKQMNEVRRKAIQETCQDLVDALGKGRDEYELMITVTVAKIRDMRTWDNLETAHKNLIMVLEDGEGREKKLGDAIDDLRSYIATIEGAT